MEPVERTPERTPAQKKPVERTAEQRAHRAQLERERNKRDQEESARKSANVSKRWQSSEPRSAPRSRSERGSSAPPPVLDAQSTPRQLSYEEVTPASLKACSLAAAAMALTMVFGPRYGILPAVALLCKFLPRGEWAEVRIAGLRLLVRSNPTVVWKGCPHTSLRTAWKAYPCTPTLCGPVGATFYGAIAQSGGASGSRPAPSGSASSSGAPLPAFLPTPTNSPLAALLPAELIRWPSHRVAPPPPVRHTPEEAVDVIAILYKIVRIDAHGRRCRSLGCGITQAVREAAGGFHIGLQCADSEYTYGSFSGKGLNILSHGSGVVRHKARFPGSAFQLHEERTLGRLLPSAVDSAATEMSASWPRASYSRVFKNCGNFVDALCWKLSLDSASQGWTQTVSQVRHAGTELFNAVAETTESLRRGVSMIMPSEGPQNSPEQVLNDARILAGLSGCESDDSDDADDKSYEIDSIVIKALGSLKVG